MEKEKLENVDFAQITELHYNIDLTYECNWACTYCCADTHNREIIIDDNKVLMQIDNAPNGSTVSFAGGEPGMVSEERIIKYCEALKEKGCVLTVDTNGTFLKRYPHLVNLYISDVLYHCVENIRERKDIIEYDFKHIPKNKNFLYQLVFTNDDSMEDVEYYLNKYPNIQFALIGANNAIVKGKRIKGLERSVGFKIYQKFKDRIFLPHAPLLFLESNKHENCESLI